MINLENFEVGDPVIYIDDTGAPFPATIHKMYVRGEHSVEVVIEGERLRDYSNRLGCMLMVGNNLVFAPLGPGEKGCFGPK